jgi:hypothetical protein
MQFPRAKTKPIVINKGRVLWQLIDLRLAFVEEKTGTWVFEKVLSRRPKKLSYRT